MSLLERLLGTVAPHTCLNCGAEGNLLCNWCRPDACPPLPSQCYRCHRLSPDSRVCEKCRPRTRLRYVWLRTEYDELAKQLVTALKFQRAQAAADTIAELMLESLPYLPAETLISHVPTSTGHVRQRGYDQAKLIAQHVARQLNCRHMTLLVRAGQLQQVGSKRQQRLTQLRGAFRPLKPGLIKGADILLVDDVLTTGGTIEAAAQTLRQNGAKHINAVIFTRAQ